MFDTDDNQERRIIETAYNEARDKHDKVAHKFDAITYNCEDLRNKCLGEYRDYERSKNSFDRQLQSLIKDGYFREGSNNTVLLTSKGMELGRKYAMLEKDQPELTASHLKHLEGICKIVEDADFVNKLGPKSRTTLARLATAINQQVEQGKWAAATTAQNRPGWTTQL